MHAHRLTHTHSFFLKLAEATLQKRRYNSEHDIVKFGYDFCQFRVGILHIILARRRIDAAFRIIKLILPEPCENAPSLDVWHACVAVYGLCGEGGEAYNEEDTRAHAHQFWGTQRSCVLFFFLYATYFFRVASRDAFTYSQCTAFEASVAYE